MLPLAAVIAIGVGLLWWGITFRQMRAPLAKFQDREREIVIPAEGYAPAFRDAPLALQNAISETVRSRQIMIPPEVKALEGQALVLAGLKGEGLGLQVLSPVATAVADVKPKFVWRPEPEATGYRITVVALESGEPVMTHELPAGLVDWTSPDSLSPGAAYSWQIQALRGGDVIALSPGPVEPSAHFQVLSAKQGQELEVWESAASGSRLALGVAFAWAGLLDQATDEFRGLVEGNPASPLTKELLWQAETRGAPRKRQPALGSR